MFVKKKAERSRPSDVLPKVCRQMYEFQLIMQKAHPYFTVFWGRKANDEHLAFRNAYARERPMCNHHQKKSLQPK